MPIKTITANSKIEDIKWLQTKLNLCLSSTESFMPLVEDGIYGAKTRIAVLIYWARLGWGETMKNDGTKVGNATKVALAAKRKS